MIDVVFSDSACGSLKIAQHYGEGGFQGGAISVFISRADGSKHTEEEAEQARKEADEKARIEWENAVPLGGDPADIYGFGLALSVGDISEDMPGAKRQQVLERMYSIFPDGEWHDIVAQLVQRANKDLKTVCDRIAAGEAVRIWYSDQPDEICGLFWFMVQLNKFNVHCSQIYLVKLPDWESDGNGGLIYRYSWGDMAPSEWHRYISLQKFASPEFCRSCASHWQTLQMENAPLRATLNGQLVSAPEHLYDDFILREIAEESDVFQEAMVIGRVLGKYRLGFSDSWVAFRIEEMIRSGKLEVVSETTEGMPVYHRLLKKSVR